VDYIYIRDASKVFDSRDNYSNSLRVIADCATSLFDAKSVDAQVGGDDFERVALEQLKQAISLLH
jgi:hypothetical protein